ncbi:MAG: hypothetical protein K0Q91_706 [Fibrobacteria bacterium]|jgi:outer membrane protein|nr:hypothetical protein [Fibrobacteria bacterium]
MKPWILPALSLAVALAALTLSWTHRGPRIAYAETSALVTEFEGSLKARKEFEALQQEWDKNLDLLNDSLLAAASRMKAGYDKAPAAERARMRADLEARNQEMQRYANAVRKMSQEKQEALMEPVLKKVNSYLDLWGREHGYDLVLGTTNGGNILQADTRLNVTRRVLDEMNAHYRDLPEATPPKKKDADALSAVTPAKAR